MGNTPPQTLQPPSDLDATAESVAPSEQPRREFRVHPGSPDSLVQTGLSNWRPPSSAAPTIVLGDPSFARVARPPAELLHEERLGGNLDGGVVSPRCLANAEPESELPPAQPEPEPSRAWLHHVPVGSGGVELEPEPERGSLGQNTVDITVREPAKRIDESHIAHEWGQHTVDSVMEPEPAEELSSTVELSSTMASVQVVPGNATSALVHAVRRGHLALVLQMLRDGAEPDESGEGEAPLVEAVLAGSADIAAALLLHGADPRQQSRLLTQNLPVTGLAEDKCMVALLHLFHGPEQGAASEERALAGLGPVMQGAVSQYLQDMRARQVIERSMLPAEEVAAAASLGVAESPRVQSPQEAPAELQVQPKSQEHFSNELSAPHSSNVADDLAAAILDNRLPDVLRLLQEGTDPNIVGYPGETPLLVAAMRGHCDVMAALLLHSADPQRASPSGTAIDDVATDHGARSLLLLFEATRSGGNVMASDREVALNSLGASMRGMVSRHVRDRSAMQAIRQALSSTPLGTSVSSRSSPAATSISGMSPLGSVATASQSPAAPERSLLHASPAFASVLPSKLSSDSVLQSSPGARHASVSAWASPLSTAERRPLHAGSAESSAECGPSLRPPPTIVSMPRSGERHPLPPKEQAFPGILPINSAESPAGSASLLRPPPTIVKITGVTESAPLRSREAPLPFHTGQGASLVRTQISAGQNIEKQASVPPSPVPPELLRHQHQFGGDGVTPSTSDALVVAVQSGDLPEVLGLLRAGADPSSGSLGGGMPLLFAARDGNVDITAALLLHSADPHLSELDDIDGTSATGLILSIFKGANLPAQAFSAALDSLSDSLRRAVAQHMQDAKVRRVIREALEPKHVSQPNSRDAEASLPEVTVAGGDATAAAGAKTSVPASDDDLGQAHQAIKNLIAQVRPTIHSQEVATLKTAPPTSDCQLAAAVQSNQLPEVLRLLRGRADANASAASGRPLLVCAAAARNANMAAALLLHSADPGGGSSLGAAMEAVPAEDPTVASLLALFRGWPASREGERAILGGLNAVMRCAMTQHFMDSRSQSAPERSRTPPPSPGAAFAGVDVAASCSSQALSAIGHCTPSETPSVAAQLAAAARRGSPRPRPTEPRGGFEWSPLGLAVRRADLPRVLLLLEQRADPSIADPAGHTPLFQAVNSGQVDITAVLLIHSADPNARTHDGIPLRNLAKDAVSRDLFDSFAGARLSAAQQGAALSAVSVGVRALLAQCFKDREAAR